MSHDDDDDDFVVPSGSRRSSYVPPTEPGEFVPSLPDVPEQDAPTSSTGPVPTIGAAGDDSIAQTPIFADSVEVPRVDSQPTGSIIIELPVEDLPVVENSLDQFGLPVVSDPIDIPPVVVSDPLPSAVAGTGSVFDDNRMFPPAMTTPEETVETFAEVVEEDPITEVFGSVHQDEPIHVVEPVSVEVPDEVAQTAEHDEPVVAAEPEGIATPAVAAVLPERQSLTPEQLAEVLGANGGMSSNDQMALLDSQIPLRESDAAAVAQFLGSFEGSDSPEAQAARSAARQRFGDVVPDLLPAVGTEFNDDTTPVTGIPIVEHVDHIEIVEIVEDEAGDVVGVAVTEIDEVVVDAVEQPVVSPREVPADDQAWSLTAPTEVVADDVESVGRRHWWSLLAVVSAIASIVLFAAGIAVAQAGAAPRIIFVLAGVLTAVPIIEFARRGSSQTGASWRASIENALGRVPGRVTSIILAILTVVALLAVLLGALDGLGHEIWASTAVGSVVSGIFAENSAAAALVALSLFGGTVIAALPHRLFRAKVLVLTGWTVVGTASVVAMGTTLLAMTPSDSLPGFDPSVTVGGIASASTLALVASVLFGFQEVSRIRESRTGILWLSIGLGLGTVVLAGTVTAALFASQGTHYFFGHNPVLHIIAPAAAVNIALGAGALVPAVLLVSTLVARFIGGVTTRDDREDPNVVLRWLLVLVPLGIGAVAYLGLTDVVVNNLPSLTAIATPIAAVLGVLAARGIVGRDVRSRAAKRGLLATVLVTSALGLGFASSDGALFEWVGFINATLRPLGYGLLYIDSAAPLATAFLSLVVSLAIVILSTRRAARNA